MEDNSYNKEIDATLRSIHHQTVKNFSQGECLKVLVTKAEWDEVFVEVVQERMMKLLTN